MEIAYEPRSRWNRDADDENGHQDEGCGGGEVKAERKKKKVDGQDVDQPDEKGEEDHKKNHSSFREDGDPVDKMVKEIVQPVMKPVRQSLKKRPQGVQGLFPF